MDTGQRENGALGGRHFPDIAVSASGDSYDPAGRTKWERS
jgi:hypothetical protein